MMHNFKSKKGLCHSAVLAALVAPLSSAMATNGMLMEGYGATATGMGGASQAYDVGNSGMAQNPATLGLQPEGSTRIGINIGLLQPDVKSTAVTPMGNMAAQSGGDKYLMPSFGYSKRSGDWTYGLGMFALGGMGTEYDANSFMGAFTQDGKPGLPSRSELGVGNVLVPVVYQVNDQWSVGATVKFVWASLDLMMNASGPQLGSLYASGNGAFAPANVAGLSSATWTRLEFSDGGKFTGAAKGNGYGLTLGTTYKLSGDVMLGGSYQLKTALSNLETGNTGATLSTSLGMLPSVNGKITVLDFQMPSVLAVGGSWKVSPGVMLAADIKHIGWSEVMDNFRMRLDTSMGSVLFEIPQKWKDQTVLNLGVAWAATEALTLRAGLNLADNPVPDQYVHPLFPAIEKNHITFGFGYHLSKNDMINASWSHVPTVTVTNPGNTATNAPPVVISHGQNNLQFNYVRSF